MKNWDEKAEYDRDLEYESRQTDEQEHTDDPEREHIRRMIAHAKHIEQECEHKYVEQDTAPLGVKCLKCGHFVGAWQ